MNAVLGRISRFFCVLLDAVSTDRCRQHGSGRDGGVVTGDYAATILKLSQTHSSAQKADRNADHDRDVPVKPLEFGMHFSVHIMHIGT